jgi:hypothetical protein
LRIALANDEDRYLVDKIVAKTLALLDAIVIAGVAVRVILSPG